MKYVKDSLYNTNLPTLVIDREKRYLKYPQIGYGGEGSVHRYNEKIAFKTFDFIEDRTKLYKKFQKIELLGNLSDESFCFPKGLIGYEDEKKEGYYTDLVISNKECKDFYYLKFIKDTRKIIEYIIKADTAIQRIHKKGIALGDIRGDNIMIDVKGNPIFVDTDNYAYENFDFDVADPRTKCLCRTFNKSFTSFDNDRYLFAMMAIQYFAFGTLIYINQSPRFFKLLIDIIDTSQEVKDGLSIIFSDAENKPYVGPIFEKIDPNQELFTEETIKVLNRI